MALLLREAQFSVKPHRSRLTANLVVHIVCFAWMRDFNKKAKSCARYLGTLQLMHTIRSRAPDGTAIVCSSGSEAAGPGRAADDLASTRVRRHAAPRHSTAVLTLLHQVVQQVAVLKHGPGFAQSDAEECWTRIVSYLDALPHLPLLVHADRLPVDPVEEPRLLWTFAEECMST